MTTAAARDDNAKKQTGFAGLTGLRQADRGRPCDIPLILPILAILSLVVAVLLFLSVERTGVCQWTHPRSS